MTSLRPGMLLVATAALEESGFADTVVLLLDVEPADPSAPGVSGGALGVVLNRPTGVPVGEVLPAWAEVVDEPEVLFQGGPVSTDGALAVGLLAPDPEQPGVTGVTDEPGAGGDSQETALVRAPVGFRPVEGRLGLLDLDTPVELVQGALGRLRIFAGYAGWGVGQLDAEVEEGSWYVVAGRPADAFGVDSAGLRREVLRRQPGDLAWHSTRPADPTTN